MREVRRQLFARSEAIDPQRIRQSILESDRNQQKGEERIKRGVNLNLFREQTRRQQRDFHQQNHQYLKMCGIMVRSSFDENKFNYIGESNRKNNNFTKGNTNSKNVQKHAPLVHVSLDDVQFSCTLVPEKFPIKDLYQLFPIRRESIIFQAHDLLTSQFIFFLYEHQNPQADNLRYKLESTIDEGILAQFKSSINKTFKNVSFFDYLYYINRKSTPPRIESVYPPFIEEISASNTQFLDKLEEDEKSMFNHDEISISQFETCERVIVCEDNDITDNGENLCFENLDQYTGYKKQKAIDFKNMKIFEKDAIINTNIRNIISTEKIYMVEIIEEIKSYIELSHECEGTVIMPKVYQHLVNKADEYLRLLCGYTESKILTVYNIENYQEKIYTFLEKSIRYKKEVRNIPPWLLKEFPVLQIWFHLPENLFGYTREELHEKLYELLEAIIIFEQKMKANNLYESLRIKRQGVEYLVD